MDPQVSICIATYQRPKALGRLLASLARLKLPPDLDVEVIVVDNDAGEAASQTVQNYTGRLSSLRYYVEPRQNIACARNRALAEARGRWLAFIDDDEVADENWLAAYLELFEAHESDGAFGPVMPQPEPTANSGNGWLDIERFFARPRHTSATPIARTATRTGNAMIRRTLFEGREFDPAFGKTGGEDVKIFGSMLDSGARFLWCDEAIVTEYVPAERQRFRWLARRAFRGGFVHQTQNPGSRKWVAALRAFVLAAAFASLAVFAVLLGRSAAARTGLRSCTQAGRLWSLLGRAFEEYTG